MTAQDVRARLLAALEADLVGPFDESGEELLPLPPSRWYLTGFLAPQFGAAPEADDPDVEDELAAGGESQADDAGNLDPEPKRRQHFPASLGLSVVLPPADTRDADDHVEVELTFADYAKELLDVDDGKRKRSAWRRLPSGPHHVAVPLRREKLESEKGIAVGSTGLRLRGELRDTDIEGLPAGARMLSLFVINGRAPLERDRDVNFVFQVCMTLRYQRGFTPRPNRQGEATDDDDLRALALQFRAWREWAVGHNTSVVDPDPDGDGVVRELRTTQLPRHEVRGVRHETIGGIETGMRRLGDLDATGLARALSPLVEAYTEWIAGQRDVALDRKSLRDTRAALLANAETAGRRIAEGIVLLESDEQIRRAFQLANQAMHTAALQADGWRDDRRYAGGAEPAWRPFQLAFVLLNLASAADPSHRDREVADLIYFPTGGGKTEAYLGLIAFTLILRRLRGADRPDRGRGVAVLLRYTLRLLTLDQLGRAATLICALEQMRRESVAERGELGDTRFTVGLWVGQSATANRLKEVHAALQDYTPGRRDSPFPLSACPWCGAEVGVRHIKMVDAAGKPSKTRFTRAVVYCEEAKCLYNEKRSEGEGLPVLFVDEQIYAEVPELVVATVDKFAMMPWRGEAGMLFGRATHIDARRVYGVMHKPAKGAELLPDGLLPPELIVQDELHLISGPLGTMVGLYETAVDYLCEREIEGVRRVPKVVCSTATVRRAREQIRALFQREISIFPPRGMDESDNFFSTVDRERSGRMYVGVAAPGRALRAVSVRTYATLLAAAARHFDPEGAADQAADPYMTLIGYFNSLRELGGMRRLVEDEVRTRVRQFDRDKRPVGFDGEHPWAASRQLRMPAELTSRESTQSVKDTKRLLAARHAAGIAAGGDDDEAPEALDTVLASNMISVGLDVDRLGLMVVAGQPKTTSEYIQATSRVGRAYPGLVVTCLNSSRPRDRSHYERFVAYHQGLYREVEATSVTPFSLQTLDRGMAGTLLSMIRHGVADMEPPVGFMNLHEHRARAEAILEELVARGRRHREWYDSSAEDRIESELRARGKNFLDAWERVIGRAVQGASNRVYSNFDRAKDQGKAVMYVATEDVPGDFDERKFCAPTSMRDVEPTTHLWLRFKPLDEGA